MDFFGGHVLQVALEATMIYVKKIFIRKLSTYGCTWMQRKNLYR